MSATLSEKISDEAGFTLLELLVAMTLLGLLMVLIFGGLRFGARVWERSAVHTSGTDDVRIAQTLIRREIEGAYPYLLAGNGIQPHIDFEGSAEGLTFLAPLPNAVLPAGRARVKLFAVTDGGSSRLVVQMRPELAAGDDEKTSEEDTLLAGLSAVRFSYFGSERPGEAPSWHDSWYGAMRLPALVRFEVTFAKGDTRLWPELVVAPRIAADVGCVYDPLTKFCQGR